MWGKQKTPLLRGSCLKPLGGLFQQHHLLGLDKLSSMNLIQIHTRTHWFTVVIGNDK